MLTRIIGFTIIVASLLFGWLMMDFDQFKNRALTIEEEAITFELMPGTTLSSLAQELNKQGLISSPLYLKILAKMKGVDAKLKAGEYSIKQGTTPQDLLTLFVSGEVINHSFTLIEGWTFEQLLLQLSRDSNIIHTINKLSTTQVLERLAISEDHPEGQFLPDTYRFPKGTSDVDFLKRANRSMKHYLQQAWEQREPNLPLKSAYEALILASIVEKETGLASERPMIAGVFIRRLKKGMKLQTDPTVIYGMGARYDGNIRRRDLTTDTPYNTYTRRGLTPTPICMPGADAIQAVLHPTASKALYFVAKGDGSHQFSATLEEHNRAVRKFQLKK